MISLQVWLSGSFSNHYWTGAELGRCQGGHCPPKFLPAPPQWSPKIFQVFFWKSYTDHWQLPLLQIWPLQWPPKWKCLAPPLIVKLNYKIQYPRNPGRKKQWRSYFLRFFFKNSSSKYQKRFAIGGYTTMHWRTGRHFTGGGGKNLPWK